MSPKQSATKLRQLHTKASKIVVEVAKKPEDLAEVCDQVGALVEPVAEKPVAAKKPRPARKR